MFSAVKSISNDYLIFIAVLFLSFCITYSIISSINASRDRQLREKRFDLEKRIHQENMEKFEKQFNFEMEKFEFEKEKFERKLDLKK